MQESRDVLLGIGANVSAQLPSEIQVIRYDPTIAGRGPVRGTPIRELFQLDQAISDAFNNQGMRSIGCCSGVGSRCPSLSAISPGASTSVTYGQLTAPRNGCVAGWTEYQSAITIEHHVIRLLAVAVRVAPRREDLQDLQTRVGLGGISVRNLREPKRGLAEEINRLASGCDTLSGSFAAAQASRARSLPRPTHTPHLMGRATGDTPSPGRSGWTQ